MNPSLDRFTDGPSLRLGYDSGDGCPLHLCAYRVEDLRDVCPQCEQEQAEDWQDGSFPKSK